MYLYIGDEGSIGCLPKAESFLMAVIFPSCCNRPMTSGAPNRVLRRKGSESMTTIVYCGVCGVPPEYCEYGISYEKYLLWLKVR